MTEGVSQPKYKVVVEKNILIPMRDGVELAADLYRPDVEGRYPAIVEYWPYHKDSFHKAPAEKVLGYFAQRGYIGVELDIRGTGSSGGSVPYGLCLQHQQDGYDAVEWIAAQPWCDGNVGMTGVSYGGWTSFTVPIQNPPHLKAVVPINMTDDFYLANYPGGNWGGYLFVAYSANMLAYNSMPPAYRDQKGRWLKVWDQHLESVAPWILPWIENPTSDAPVWRESSFRDKYDKIRVPTFIIGGWHDAYPSMPRIYAGIKAPKKLLMGPWSHVTPDEALPGPRIDYLNEMLRWFDYWLKGVDTKILDEPPITIYVQRYTKPAAIMDEVVGTWRYENEWPIERALKTPFYLHPHGVLSREPYSGDDRGVADVYEYNPTVGVTSAGKWVTALGINMGTPTDQRRDDAFSLTYTTEPLQNKMEVTGVPHAILYASSSADVATFVARVCDVAPDETSALVATGHLNATHRESHETVRPLTPGEAYELAIELDATSYVFEEGHRIRLAISSADFPCVWPSPKPAVNSIYRSGTRPSRIILPVISQQDPPLPRPQFRPPPPMTQPSARSEGPVWRTVRDEIGSTVSVEFGFQGGLDVDSKTKISYQNSMVATASNLNPEDVCMKSVRKVVVDSPVAVTSVKGVSSVQSSQDMFEVFQSVDVTVDGMPHFSKNWFKSVPRKLL